jgi:hypothetical protein
MTNAGIAQEAKNAESARLEDVAEKVRRIQPRRWQLALDICVGALALGQAVWWYHARASESSIEPGVIFGWSVGCALVAVFFIQLTLRFRLKALLYDLVWHG